MRFWRKKSVAVRTIVPGRRRFRRKRAEAEAALQARLLAQQLHEPDVHSHPWCFALLDGQRALTGAIHMQTGTVLYVALSLPEMAAVLDGHGSLAFWLARALAPGASVTHRALRTVCRAIERHYRAGAGLQQTPPLVALLADRCEADYASTERCGVQSMPWAAWPACIHQGEYLWLWKQNQHGRIVASRRIPLIHK